jgi:predicted glycoside hydrolase/deacetylase ChbG (UPF0249 family)
VTEERLLVVTADDFGIGPETSRGILELGLTGRVTCTVLLVNSPYAEESVVRWRKAGCVPVLGWHPCLTLDRPVASPDRVPSLVDSTGAFWPRAVLLRRLAMGLVRADDVRTEFRAQLIRVCELIGGPPPVVNGHHHIHVFPMLGGVLREILSQVRPKPYLRRLGEPTDLLFRIRGAELKRLTLATLGRWAGEQSRRVGLPGNEWLLGLSDPPSAASPDNFVRWISRAPGSVVELMCHPGRYDATLIGRDCTVNDGWLDQRVQEFGLLRSPRFLEACREAGFRLAAPTELPGATTYGRRRLAA